MSENQLTAKSIEKFTTELDVLIRARYPLISINTYEEDCVRECLKDLVFKEKHKEKPLYFWSRPLGLQKIVDPKEGVLQNPSPVGDTEQHQGNRREQRANSVDSSEKRTRLRTLTAAFVCNFAKSAESVFGGVETTYCCAVVQQKTEEL